MRCLITSDWQAQFSNLHKLNQLVERIFDICQSQNIQTLIHLGDAKHVYNPVDGKILNWFVKLAKRFERAGIDFYLLRGNHDRYSMNADGISWFPALQAAGIKTISKPRWVEIDGVSCLFMPFYSDTKEITEYIANTKIPPNSVLFFHNEIDRVRIHTHTKIRLDSPLKIEDLRYTEFKYCIGGHIHLPQTLYGNTFFVGSPFSHDWGEVNQVKRFLIFDTKTLKLRSVGTGIPGLYDPNLPNFDEAIKDASVLHGGTIRVSADLSLPIHDHVNAARTEAEKLYPGARIIVVPQLSQGAAYSPSSNTKSQSDETWIRDWWAKTQKPNIEKAVSYLTYVLDAQRAKTRQIDNIRFLYSEAQNYLSFKSVSVKYRKGITLVTGVNKDWKSQSNGSGKSSLLSLPAVAICGRTLKNQKANRWVKRGCKARAFVRCVFKLADGRKCEIYRQRNPLQLKLYLDGKEVSTGKGPDETQALIEAITGLTWEVVVNSLYLDQKRVNSLLEGTDSQRKAILSQILNLERFDKGREYIRAELLKTDQLYAQTAYQIEVLTESIAKLQTNIDMADVFDLLRMKSEMDAVQQRLKNAKSELAHESRQMVELERLAKKYEFHLAEHEAVSNEAYHERMKQEMHQNQIRNLLDLRGECPVCHQAVDAAFSRQYASKIETKIAASKKLETALRREAQTTKDIAKAVEAKVQSLKQYLGNLKATVYALQQEHDAKRELLDHAVRHNKQITTLRRDLDDQKTRLRIAQDAAIYLREEKAFLEDCITAFSKRGIPIYLMYQLCPYLNQAAAYYSDLFTGGKIKIRFALNKEAIDLEIENETGGELVQDQSGGELRMASLLVSLSVRETLQFANLLVLDDPAESLSHDNARIFADGLKQMADRFGCIMVATLNDEIVNALTTMHCHRIHVVKSKGASRVVASDN